MIDIADESSIRIGAAASRPDAGWILFFQSAYSRKPRLMRDESMRASPASMRSISSYFDISSENSRTGILCCSAACIATLTAHDVLPPPGRAATMIRFSRCRPAVSSSSFVNPVGTPVRGAHLEVVQHLLHHVAGGGVGLAPVLLRDLEDLRLRLVQERLELAEVAERARLHLGARRDQAPQRRLLAHDARVVQHVLRRRDDVGEMVEVAVA